MAQQENHMPLDLPSASTHQTDDSLSQRMTINIHHDGQIQIGTATVEPDRVARLLVKHQSMHDASAAVRIRTDKTVTYGIVEPLLREIASAGIVDITFAVRQEK